jgi:hypothetical protein
MTALRHGFRAEAERLAIELRGELGLGPRERVDPHDLAALYGIPVLSSRDLDVDPCYIAYFSATDTGAWSALTAVYGTYRMIVLNAAHGAARLANSLTHELAHMFLEHDPTPVMNRDGSRTWNPEVEAEANELGAQILIPDETARGLAVRGYDPEVVAQQFGVSYELALWRMNLSGGFIIRRRAHAKR